MGQRRSDPIVSPAPLVRWGGVFAGTIIGLALTLLAGSLWSALAFASHRAVFYNHLAWWFAGTGIVATFIAALVAAAVSGNRGLSAGLANGVTTWGLLVIGSFAGGIAALVSYGASRPITVNGTRVAVTTVRPWTTFWALLIAFGVAVIGGAIGGFSRRSRVAVVSGGDIDLRERLATSEVAPEPTASIPAAARP
jgi:hypothetical protein